MKMADVAAFDNLEDLAEMAEGLATFVRQAADDGTAAHVAEMSTARAWDNGSTSCRSTPGWNCPRARTRICFRIGRERFRRSMRLAARPKRSTLSR